MSEKFNNLFMRPNVANKGTIPPEGSLASSPDIWCAGTIPVADYKTKLASAENYEIMSPDESTANMDNYCYVRCKNNTTDTIAKTQVELYYTKASLVTWPSNWQNMKTALGPTAGEIRNISPGGIGVVEQPFIWHKPSLPSTGDHYCLLARLFQSQGDNPVPSVRSPVDMAVILKSNLRWAQKNVRVRDCVSPDGDYQFYLDVPANVTAGSGKYYLYFQSNAMEGIEVEVQASSTDSKGNQIHGKSMIVDDRDIFMGQYYLNPGFSAVLTVYIYYHGHTPKPGASTDILLIYHPSSQEYAVARSLNLGAFQKRLVKTISSQSRFNDLSDVPLVPIGGYATIYK